MPAFYVGGGGIAVGLITTGIYTMRTVGKKVIKVDFYKGFACQFATANCVMLGTRLGIPLSTTHCNVGTLFGIVLANKILKVQDTYKCLGKIDDYLKKNNTLLADTEGQPEQKPLNATRGDSLLQST